MADFDKFAHLIAKAEGGYQNNPTDKAGNTNSKGELVGTNHGISAPVYEAFIGHPPTKQEMQTMTHQQALQIYQDQYWTIIQGDQINNQMAANAIGDMTVNSGKVGIQLAHERLWLDGYNIDPPASNDRFNNQGVAALNAMTDQENARFVNAYTQDRLNYYMGLGEEFDGSKAGWDNRLTNYFPEDKQAEGWQDAKEKNYFFTTENIQHIVYANEKGETDKANIDGVLGPNTQAALKDWQTTNNLQPTGYLDAPTAFVMQHQIMDTDATRQVGELNKMMGEAREIRQDLKQEAQEMSVHKFDTLYQQGNPFVFQNEGATAGSTPLAVTFSNDKPAIASDRSSMQFSNQGHAAGPANMDRGSIDHDSGRTTYTAREVLSAGSGATDRGSSHSGGSTGSSAATGSGVSTGATDSSGSI